MAISDDIFKRLNSYVSDPAKLAADVQTGQQIYNFADEHGAEIIALTKDPEFMTLVGKVKEIIKVRKMQAAGLGDALAAPAPATPTTLSKLNKYADAYLWYLNNKILTWSLVGVGAASLVGGGYLLGRYLHKSR